jgi:Raf kinase inhibitor-like YbhB/YbcL family protein
MAHGLKINLGTLRIASPAFEHGSRLPDRFAPAGQGVSPALEWDGVPEGTGSFALIMHDPDAPLAYGFTHWVLYGIPADVRSLQEGGGGEFTAGTQGFKGSEYVPPGPPPGHGDHYYYFHLYALDADLGLEAGLEATELMMRIDPHIIEQARIVGTYSNQ